MNEVMQIATIAVGDYAYGAAALINSLASCGFSGHVTVGYQKQLDWELQPGVPVTCLELDSSPKWAGNLKAQLMSNMGRGDVCYIDADCIVTSKLLLSIASEFVRDQPLFAAEGVLAASDIRWRRWEHCLSGAAKGGTSKAAIVYFNSGFFALNLPRDEHIISQWQEAVEKCLTGRGALFETPFFPMADQDCLNAVLASLNQDFVSIGPPDVWYRALPFNPFLHVGVARKPLLLHCTGGRKPWRECAPTVRPDIYDRAFYHFAFENTPWVQLKRGLPPSTENWLVDGIRSRINVRARRGLSNLRLGLSKASPKISEEVLT